MANWLFGLAVDKFRDNKRAAHGYLTLMVLWNVSIFFVYKYLNFTITNVNALFGTTFPLTKFVLPIGISFFTFQAMSYVIDVYRGNGSVQKNPLNVALYITFFPQLIAGPIVRYETVANEIQNRKETFDDFSKGTKRFIIGLGKKIILSNSLAVAADAAFNMESYTNLSAATAWLGALAYALQIYFDFGGYSDMAIGLGLMFGFHFDENFNYPYITKSVSEFWRRWHISLSSWLKDYIYIPLGGSRVPFWKYCRNILLTWLATGLWHGANWNFVLWGLFFAVFLIIEKVWLLKVFKKHSILAHCYTIFFILISFVIFSFDDLSSMSSMLQNMFSISNPIITREALYYVRDYFVVILIALFAATPIAKNLMAKVRKSSIWKRLSFLEVVFYFGLFFLCVAFLVDESFNPFLYFRF